MSMRIASSQTLSLSVRLLRVGIPCIGDEAPCCAKRHHAHGSVSLSYWARNIRGMLKSKKQGSRRIGRAVSYKYVTISFQLADKSNRK